MLNREKRNARLPDTCELYLCMAVPSYKVIIGYFHGSFFDGEALLTTLSLITLTKLVPSPTALFIQDNSKS